MFLGVKTTFRYTYPSSHLQCLPPDDPRVLCANTGIRLLATHSLSSSLYALQVYNVVAGALFAYIVSLRQEATVKFQIFCHSLIVGNFKVVEKILLGKQFHGDCFRLLARRFA